MAQTYIWQKIDLRQMTWQTASLATLLAELHQLRGTLLGKLGLLGFKVQDDTTLYTMAEEIVHSSEIEGERLNRDSVRSSVARHLGLPYEGLPTTDHYVEGVVQAMIDATQRAHEPLTAERLFGWHAALFPTGYSGMYKITTGHWREGDAPMQVVSGPMGRERVHYEAPPSHSVAPLMADFLAWVEAPDATIDPLVKVAVAHLWFVTIHPFDDGNGRLCRTLSELLLARTDNTPQRYYSLSSELLRQRKDYYAQLEQAQKGGVDITPWIAWFLQALRQALVTASEHTSRSIYKVRFWDTHQHIILNERQRKVLNRLLDGFEGKLTSSKYYKINHCSQDTANRDLNDLVQKGILRKSHEGGRSTYYDLIPVEE